MKKHFFLLIVLFFGVFFVQSVELTYAAAATPTGQSVLSLVESEDMLSSKKMDVWEYVGIGKMADKIRSPIQTLAETSQLQGESGEIGGRLRKVMRPSDFTIEETTWDDSQMLTTEIIGGDLDIEAGASDQGRMYPPRLEMNFQAYPTFAMQPTWTQQHTVRVNKQIQTRLNPQLRLHYSSNSSNEVPNEQQSVEPNGVNRVEIVSDEQGWVLRGTVATEREKNVLEHFVRMEPGVKELKNELLVQPLDDKQNPLP